MQAIDFVIDTLSHFVRQKEGPPPGVPAHTDPDFEQDLIWLCEWHALTPIVLASIERLALRPNISRITLERIRALAGASRSMTNDLLTTTASLSRHFKGDIDVMFMGGAHLTGAVYSDRKLRPMDGIEVLIREEQWSFVIERCQQMGFRLAPGLPFFHNGHEALGYYQHFTSCVLENDKGDRLQLRMRVFDLGEPDASEPAWGRCQSLADNGIQCVGLEDELIRSCVVYNMTDFGKLLHAVDIGLVVSRFGGELDWDYIDDRLRSKFLYSAFWFTLDNVIDWLKLDAASITLIDPGRVRKKIFGVIWHADYDSFAMRRPERLHRYRFYLFEMGNWRDKLRFIGALLSPRPEWVAAFFDRPYNPWLKLKFVLLTVRNRVGLRPTGNP